MNYDELVKRTDAMLQAGTLVWAPGEKVAYAFVVPVAFRDDLAEALADLAAEEMDA